MGNILQAREKKEYCSENSRGEFSPKKAFIDFASSAGKCRGIRFRQGIEEQQGFDRELANERSSRPQLRGRT